MKSINRFAMVVRPQRPYFEWASSLAEDALEEIEPWTSVYLIESEEVGDPEPILRLHFDEIFEEQLTAWHRDSKAWPKKRTFELFQKWFDAEVVDLVFDMGNSGIESDA